MVLGQELAKRCVVFGIKVNPSTHNGIGFKPTSNGSFGALRTLNAAGSEVCNIQYDTTNANINFRTSNTQRASITSGGNLLLGTTTAAISGGVGLMIADAAGGRIKLCDSDLGVTASDGFELIASDNGTAYIWNRENMPVLFGTNNTERMQIDANGRLLIAATSGTARVHIKGSGGDGIKIENSGGTNAACIDLKNTLSSYVKEYRIAVAGSDGAYGSASSLFVRDQTAGATRLELATSGDFKVNSGDIFFGTAGKGICLGNTANVDANTLDDYEEGVFIVTLANSLAATGSQKRLSYTKIGNKVHISGQFQVTTGGSDLIVNNLPFTTKSTGGTDETFSTSLVKTTNVTFPTDGNASGEIQAMVLKNDTNMSFIYTRSGNDPNSHTGTTNGYYTVSLWYTT